MGASEVDQLEKVRRVKHDQNDATQPTTRNNSNEPKPQQYTTEPNLH